MYSTSLKGPVPIGFLLSGFLMNSVPSHRCLGRIALIALFTAFITAGEGVERRRIATCGSLASTLSSALNAPRPHGCSFEVTFSNENFTSADVNGAPSCHTTFLRR